MAPLQPGHTLAAGTRLRDYEISGLIGEGGFGIVYLAWDHSLQRKVAVKEYMPASMASRVAGSSAIVVKSERHVETFRAGLKSFVNEARLLARFDHASLVKVYRFWEENGTAYMVMPFYKGPTLKAALDTLGRAPSEGELRAWLHPLLAALGVMHAAHCYHRDIAPDNILITPTGPLLLDFGAARRVIGGMTHALTVVLKPGYAPIEQYGDVATMGQGPWTDIYALACVVYCAITGRAPMSSVERLMDDRLQPLAVAAAGRYGPAFLRAIDSALAVRPPDRPQNEREFRALLDAEAPAPAPAPAARFPTPATSAPPKGASSFPTTAEQAHPTVPGARPRPPAEVPAPPAAQTLRSPEANRPAQAGSAPRAALSPPAPLRPAARPRALPAPNRSWAGRWFLALLVLLVAAVGIAFVWVLPRHGDKAAAAALPATVPASVAESAPAVLPAATPAPAPASAPASAAPQVVEPPLAPPAAEPASGLPSPDPAEPRRASAVTRPAASTAAPRTRREAAPALRPEPAARAPARVTGARCSDILQKGSLEPLSAEEGAYLKRECR